jgi:FGGY-family pentulose kinase
VKFHSEPITIFKPKPDYFEQSSDDIWKKVCICVREVASQVDKNEIKGIGFDATCSLVLFDENENLVSVSPSGDNNQNIIMWLDHRAEAEANFINSTKHEILKFVGGKVSLEMEIPKILWMKRHMNENYQKIQHAFDLPDFLTWRATNIKSRSICSVTCKWNYDAIQQKWSENFFKSVDLEELAYNNFSKIGNKILFPGDRVGGLTSRAAKELNLLEGTSVACSMIDAHAGALGLISAKSQISNNDVSSKLILIAGTSTCHMSVTKDCIYSPGIWGPYKHALLPNYYLIEAGQSAAGILIDFVIQSHPNYSKTLSLLKEGESIYEHLFDEIKKIAFQEKLISFHELTKKFHIYPDFHGNRSPIGDNSLRGMISGCSMSDSIYLSYLAIVQSLAYSTKHIIDSLYNSGREKFKSILICGGLSKNKLYVQTHADVCGIPVLISNEEEMVLIGAAMLGATASGFTKSLEETASILSSDCYQIQPEPNSFDFHSRKFKVFLKMLQDQKSYDDLMK